MRLEFSAIVYPHRKNIFVVAIPRACVMLKRGLMAAENLLKRKSGARFIFLHIAFFVGYRFDLAGRRARFSKNTARREIVPANARETARLSFARKVD